MDLKKNILFATDLTKDSLQVLEYAIDYAEKSFSNLVLLHVIELSSQLSTKINKLTNNNTTTLLDLESIPNAMLDAIKERIKKCHSIDVQYQVLHGNLINATMQYIYQNEPDILMLAATDSRTAYKFADSSPIPTITINSDTQFKEIKTILFPVSEKFYTTYKTDEIIRISKIYNAKVIVLGISDNKTESVDTVNYYMETVINKLSDNNITTQSNKVNSKDYTEAISKFADEHDVDLISIISNYETGFLSLFYKTPDEKLIKSSTLPVISIPIVIDTTTYKDINSEYISPWSMKYDINTISLGI